MGFHGREPLPRHGRQPGQLHQSRRPVGRRQGDHHVARPGPPRVGGRQRVSLEGRQDPAGLGLHLRPLGGVAGQGRAVDQQQQPPAVVEGTVRKRVASPEPVHDLRRPGRRDGLLKQGEVVRWVDAVPGKPARREPGQRPLEELPLWEQPLHLRRGPGVHSAQPGQLAGDGLGPADPGDRGPGDVQGRQQRGQAQQQDHGPLQHPPHHWPPSVMPRRTRLAGR